MPTITVKNIPQDTYEQLKHTAKLNHRSLNSEIIACIERVVRSQLIDPELLIANARQVRELTASYKITEDEFNRAKNEGRP